MKIDRIILITRQTRLEENIKRYNTKQQAKFVIESRGQSFEDYELEYSNYQKAKDQILKLIPRYYNVREIDRSFLPNYIFGANDLVIVLGQDGLVANTAKYLNGQPVIAINPDPQRFDGVLLPFLTKHTKKAIQCVEDNHFSVKQISMAKVELGDGQYLYAFNDLFVGVNTQTSARYSINFMGETERQVSSGIIISTPAGSTGWLSSLFNMTKGITAYSGLDPSIDSQKLDWEEQRLIFMVREPFKSKWSDVSLVAGDIYDQQSLVLESHMADGGVIFSDGMLSDYLEFNSGSTAEIKLADKTTGLIVELN